MKQQTAVSWLAEQLKKQGFLYDLDIEAAKEKEKKQIIDAYNQADLDGYFQKIYPKYAEEYYNQTYNQNK